MKIELSKQNRISARTLSNEKQAIINKHMAVANIELNEIRKQMDELYATEREFRQEASNLLKTLKQGDVVNIAVQVGPNGSEIIHRYENAEIESVSVINFSVNTFNVSVKEINEGKPFTIGLSCLLSIEKIS